MFKKLRNGKKIIVVVLSVTIIHFILTSVIGHYIGTQIGKIVADGLIEASDKNPDKAEEGANRIYQNMKSKSDGILESWKIPRLLISLPVKPLMTPLLQEMRKNQINKVVVNEITKEQFRTRGIITAYTANFLNSLSFGLLVYIIIRIFNQYKRKT